MKLDTDTEIQDNPASKQAYRLTFLKLRMVQASRQAAGYAKGLPEISTGNGATANGRN